MNLVAQIVLTFKLIAASTIWKWDDIAVRFVEFLVAQPEFNPWLDRWSPPAPTPEGIASLTTADPELLALFDRFKTTEGLALDPTKISAIISFVMQVIAIIKALRAAAPAPAGG